MSEPRIGDKRTSLQTIKTCSEKVSRALADLHDALSKAEAVVKEPVFKREKKTVLRYIGDMTMVQTYTQKAIDRLYQENANEK